MPGISCSLRCRKSLQQFHLVVTEPGAEPRRTVERPAQRAQRVLAQQAGEGDLRINTVALAAPKITAGARRHMRYFFAQYHFQNSHRFPVPDPEQQLDNTRGDRKWVV